jgi:hypothetical protein
MSYPELSNYRHPDLDKIGQRYQHFRNKKIYELVGYVFNAEIGEYWIQYKCVSDLDLLPAKYCVRSLDNFHEYLPEEKTRRFTEL